MLFSAIIALTLSSFILEFMILAKFPKVFQLLKDKPALGIVFSLGLSLAIGHFFGAAGMVIMLAGMASTVIAAFYYSSANKVKTAVKSIFKSKKAVAA